MAQEKERIESYDTSRKWYLNHRCGRVMTQAVNIMQILRKANVEAWHNGVHDYSAIHTDATAKMEQICERLEKAMAAFEQEIQQADNEIDELFFKNKELYDMSIDTHLWYLERDYQKNPSNYTTLERWLFQLWKWLRKDRLQREPALNTNRIKTQEL